MQNFDIIFIGGGPGGYVGALYAAKKGLKVALAEERELGGTCLNKGCIPTKALLAISHQIGEIKRSESLGFFSGDLKINYPKILDKKDSIVLKLKNGIEALFKSRGITLLSGKARLNSKNTILLNNEEFAAKNIVIATGSKPKTLSCFDGMGESVLTSDDIVNLKDLPKSLLIIGGGAIGSEYADMFAGFGVKVVLIEMLDRLIPNMDRELSIKLEMALKKKGIEVFTKSKIEKFEKKGLVYEILLSNGKTYEIDKLLVSIGRKPNTLDLGFEKIGVNIEKDAISVDKYLRTSCDSIYAIGDVKGGLMLAHVASHEAVTVVDNVLGKAEEMDYSSVPNCIYTEPEIASIGIKDDEAKVMPNAKIAKFPLTALGKAQAIFKEEGFIKIIFDGETKKILGAHIFGHSASDLISELALAKRNGLGLNQIKSTVHPHPTLSEMIMESAFIGLGEGIHSL